MKKYFILFSLITCLSTSLYGALVAHYEFENDIDDSTSNSYDLNVSGGGAESYSSTSKRGSSSYNFNGNDNYLELKNQGSFVNSESGSISFWIKTSSNNDTSFFRMDDAENIELLSKNDSLTAFYDNGAFGDTKDEKDNPGIYDNNWHMITETFSTTNGSEKMYIDGSLVSLDTNQNNKFGLGKKLYLGGKAGSSGSWGFFSGSGSQYNGLMDDLRIYDNELTATEVYELYNPTIINNPNVISVPISPKLYILLTISLLFIGIKQTKS